MELDMVECVGVWRGHQLAVLVEVHAVAGAYGVLLVAELDGDEAVGAPRYRLVHVYLVAMKARVAFAQRVLQVDLRMEGEMARPPLGLLGKAVELVAGAGEIAAVRDVAQSPLAVAIVRLQQELALVIARSFVAADLAVLVRGHVEAERTDQVNDVLLVAAAAGRGWRLFDVPLLFLAHRRSGRVHLVAEALGRQVLALAVHEADRPANTRR